MERIGTDIEDAIANLQPYKENIYVIQQLIQNDVSSTKIRLFLRREMSIQYLSKSFSIILLHSLYLSGDVRRLTSIQVPAPVIEYIEQNELYLDESVGDGKGKTNGQTSGRASPAIGSSSKS